MNFKIKEKRQGKTISINSALSLILEEFGLKDTLILDKLRLRWRNIVGELMAAHSIPDRVFKKILFIAVDHPVYSNELSMMKGSIINELNKEYGAEMIKDIRLETKKLDWQRLYNKNV
jgi:hypothetical protein